MYRLLVIDIAGLSSARYYNQITLGKTVIRDNIL